MRILIKNFGELLISRPAGREAALAAEAYLFSTLSTGEEIELDFEGVKVVAPSWLDEFLLELQSKHSYSIKILPIRNASLIESLKVIESPPPMMTSPSH